MFSRQTWFEFGMTILSYVRFGFPGLDETRGLVKFRFSGPSKMTRHSFIFNNLYDDRKGYLIIFLRKVGKDPIRNLSLFSLFSLSLPWENRRHILFFPDLIIVSETHKPRERRRRKEGIMITIPYLTAVSTYFSYGLLFAFGQLRDYTRLIFDWCSTNNLHGYAPICLAHEDFYIRRLYHRIQVPSNLICNIKELRINEKQKQKHLKRKLLRKYWE